MDSIIFWIVTLSKLVLIQHFEIYPINQLNFAGAIDRSNTNDEENDIFMDSQVLNNVAIAPYVFKQLLIVP